MQTVSLVRCADYEQSRVDEALERAMAPLGGIESFVKPGDRVLLKINLLLGAAPERAITTHPAVVRAVIGQVLRAGGVPAVGDCSGFEGPPSRSRFLGACRKSGIKQLCDDEGVELVQMSAESVEVETPEARAFKRFRLARRAVEADVLINLPKLKTHGLTSFTGAVKNNFGCLPGLEKAQMHLKAQAVEDFSQMLVDLLLAVRPELTVMDAVLGMDGNGPSNGRPRQIGALLAGTDPVAVDSVACRLVGIDPMRIATTRLAQGQGVGVAHPEQVQVAGEQLSSPWVTDFRVPSGQQGLGRFPWLRSFAKNRLTARPEVVEARCKGCWTCQEHCPAGAITRNGKLPAFDYARCIRCYCCQELCPDDALSLRRPLLARLLPAGL